MGLPILAFVQACQPSSENYLGSESGFDVAGKDGAVAYLWRDHLIDGEQRTLAKVSLLRIRIGIGSGRTGGFAVKVGGVMVAATIDDLRC